jgi:hypothetical protein
MVYAVICLVKISCNYVIQYTIQSTISVKINKSDINTDPSLKTVVFEDGSGVLDGMSNRHGMTVYEVGSMK